MASSALAHTDVSTQTGASWFSSSTLLGIAALVTGVALVVLSNLLASGRFTPMIQAHAAYYGATVLAVLSIIPFAVSACLLCRN